MILALALTSAEPTHATGKARKSVGQDGLGLQLVDSEMPDVLDLQHAGGLGLQLAKAPREHVRGQRHIHSHALAHRHTNQRLVIGPRGTVLPPSHAHPNVPELRRACMCIT